MILGYGEIDVGAVSAFVTTNLCSSASHVNSVCGGVMMDMYAESAKHDGVPPRRMTSSSRRSMYDPIRLVTSAGSLRANAMTEILWSQRGLPRGYHAGFIPRQK